MPNINKILIVDPDPNSVLRMAKPFRQHGWEIVVASDAVQAQSIVRKEKPSAMVLSSHLPGGALLMLRRIRSSVHTVGLPVIVIAKSEGGGRAEFISAGANEFITKAHDAEAICAAIKKHLDLDAAEGHASPPAPAPLGSTERMAPPDEAEFLDNKPDPLLDSIAEAAVQLLHVPAALLSMVDKDLQVLKSQKGLPEPWCTTREAPLSDSLCPWVVAEGDELAVADTSEYPALAENFTMRDLGVVSYAGARVFSAKGVAVGSFCVIDSKARTWMPWELALLRNLARMSEAALLLEKNKSRGAAQRSRRQAIGCIIINATQILRREYSIMENPGHGALLAMIESQAQDLADYFAEKPPQLKSRPAFA